MSDEALHVPIPLEEVDDRERCAILAQALMSAEVCADLLAQAKGVGPLTRRARRLMSAIEEAYRDACKGT